ncbi:MAG: peptidyl-prolyl cis-trans isomerase [Deltaproteobacteria bacterium]|nr:MAG: peptidyl-prolyl cis-trans isomerase [Deltaproteobacteria bacterium]
MCRWLCVLILLLTLTTPALAGTRVQLQTSMGDITLELFDDKAPKTVANFLNYVDSGFYNGTIFHRVIDGFMIQGGGFDAQLQRKKTLAPIRNEAANGLGNKRGAIAMARTRVIDSATSQSFINLVDNAFLDHRGDTPQTFGYAVFGRVIAGMDVVDRIGKSKTVRKNALFQNLPEPPVVITSARRLP